ncbi:MAG TPA: ABC transporter permease [Tepidisphaeraceae bacterium]|jgi:spermidine/putrescine transport system permease protein|nr:ABC transporter permease [Tepidisphaeraceae bacterium]
MSRETPITSAGSLSRPAWRGWSLFAILAGWLILFVVLPTLILLVYSFFRGGNGEVEPAFTFANYAKCFRAPYPAVFGWSLAYAALTTALCALIGYPVAFYIGRSSPARRNRLLMLIMIPFATSFLIRTYAWMTLLSHDGLVMYLLRVTHLIPLIFPENLQLLYTNGSVLIVLVYSYLPFMILPIYGSVEKLDESLIEAAADLGAGPFRAFTGVIFPLTLPGVAAGALMVFVPAVAMFAVTTLMSGGNIRLIGDEIEFQCLEGGNLPFGSALGMILLAMFVLSFFLFMRRGAGAKADMMR